MNDGSQVMYFRDGVPAGLTNIHPTVKAIAYKRGINAWQNWHASEPRWEASDGVRICFGDDPNEVILDCAYKQRTNQKR